MTIESVNLLALLAATVANMALGFLWYSPVLFAKQWTKLMGYTAESMKQAQKDMGTMYLLSTLSTLVTAFVLAQVFAWLQIGELVGALSTCFILWLGFIAPVQFTDVLFGRKLMNLFLINTGYQLAGMLVMGAVLFHLS